MDIPNLSILVQAGVKIMALVGIGLYVIFAAIMVRQEHLMDKVIDETFEPVFRVLVAIHLIAAIGLWIVAFVIL